MERAIVRVFLRDQVQNEEIHITKVTDIALTINKLKGQLAVHACCRGWWLVKLKSPGMKTYKQVQCIPSSLLDQQHKAVGGKQLGEKGLSLVVLV